MQQQKQASLLLYLACANMRGGCSSQYLPREGLVGIVPKISVTPNILGR
jgi:hypothetical protein